MDDSRREHLSRTRYVRPVESVSFTGSELVSSLVSSVGASGLLSINQLHGDRKGTVRVSLRTPEAATEFDTRLASRKVHVNGIRVAAVSDSGHFIKVSLLDVPEYLSSADVERALREYGPVAHVKREYLEVQGHKIENETRHVFFSLLLKDLPPKLQVEGQDVFVFWSNKSGGSIKAGRPAAGGGGGASPGTPPQGSSTGPGASAGPNHQQAADRQIKQIKEKHMPSPVTSPEVEKVLPEVGNLSLPSTSGFLSDPKRGLVEIIDSPGMSRRTFTVDVQVQAETQKKNKTPGGRDVTDQQTTTCQNHSADGSLQQGPPHPSSDAETSI